jgi:hypothetical protein
LDIIVAVGMEGRDKVGGVVIKGVVLGDGEEEVMLDIFFLWTPDFLTMFIDDGVLMRMVVDGGGTRQGSEEVGEEVSFRVEWKQEDGEDRSG